MKQLDILKLPFFAKLLESQESDPSTAGQQSFWPPVSTGKFVDDGGYHTMKYPSDNDEQDPI